MNCPACVRRVTFPPSVFIVKIIVRPLRSDEKAIFLPSALAAGSTFMAPFGPLVIFMTSSPE